METETRHLTANINTFSKDFVEGKQKIFFEIEVQFIYNRWTLKKRYSDFEALQKDLRQTFSFLPSLPGKSFFALKKDADIEKRRVGLDHYIKELVKRSEVYSDSTFIDFFEVKILIIIC